jgi:hypothetical protein
MKDAIIFFNIKDKVLIRSNQCLAEAFLSFEHIPEHSQLKENQQTHLTLTRLQSDGETMSFRFNYWIFHASLPSQTLSRSEFLSPEVNQATSVPRISSPKSARRSSVRRQSPKFP